MTSLAPDTAWRSLVVAASAPYRRSGRFAWHFARGKLRFDPVFEHLLRDGLIGPGERVLDIGCGQGLLASLLSAAGIAAHAGDWPAAWAAAPARAVVTGIELMPKEVERARVALGPFARLICGDMRRVAFPPSDVVVVLDSLHYIATDEQEDVLARARLALGRGGRIVLRIADLAAEGRLQPSRWVDHLVAFARRRRVVAQATRPAHEWAAQLRSLGFKVDRLPMHRGTPFANVLLVGRLA